MDCATGVLDTDCDLWDHVISLTVADAAASSKPGRAAPANISSARPSQLAGFTGAGVGVSLQRSTDGSPSLLGEPGGSITEMARFVTPYRRRVGHWLTDVTSLAPLLNGMDACTPPFA